MLRIMVLVPAIVLSFLCGCATPPADSTVNLQTQADYSILGQITLLGTYSSNPDDWESIRDTIYTEAGLICESTICGYIGKGPVSSNSICCPGGVSVVDGTCTTEAGTVAVAGPIGLIKGWVIGTEDGPVVETRFIQAYLPPAIGTTHALASQSQHEASEVALFAVRVVNWADDHPDFYVYRFKGGTQPVEVCIRACEEGCDDSSCSKSMESGPVDDPYDDRYIKASWKTDKYVLEGPVERDQWEQLNGHNTLMNRLRDQWKKITDELP